MGIEISAHSEHILERRGWVHSSTGPVPSMRGRGLSEDEIIDELIDILIQDLNDLCARDR